MSGYNSKEFKKQYGLSHSTNWCRYVYPLPSDPYDNPIEATKHLTYLNRLYAIQETKFVEECLYPYQTGRIFLPGKLKTMQCSIYNPVDLEINDNSSAEFELKVQQFCHQVNYNEVTINDVRDPGCEHYAPSVEMDEYFVKEKNFKFIGRSTDRELFSIPYSRGVNFRISIIHTTGSLGFLGLACVDIKNLILNDSPIEIAGISYIITNNRLININKLTLCKKYNFIKFIKQANINKIEGNLENFYVDVDSRNLVNIADKPVCSWFREHLENPLKGKTVYWGPEVQPIYDMSSLEVKPTKSLQEADYIVFHELEPPYKVFQKYRDIYKGSNKKLIPNGLVRFWRFCFG